MCMYLYMHLLMSLHLPWNSIHSECFWISPVHILKFKAISGMLLQLTIVSFIVASCPDLDAQHLSASIHVSPSVKNARSTKQYIQNNICLFVSYHLLLNSYVNIARDDMLLCVKWYSLCINIRWPFASFVNMLLLSNYSSLHFCRYTSVI